MLMRTDEPLSNKAHKVHKKRITAHRKVSHQAAHEVHLSVLLRT